MDVVWDSYNTEHLKAHMREDVLFTGFHLPMSERTRMPQNLGSCFVNWFKQNSVSYLIASVSESAVSPEG